MIRVSVGVLVCPQRGVLLLRTVKDGPLYGAGYWECPGGKLGEEFGEQETTGGALAREISEETGLEIGRNARLSPWCQNPMVWMHDFVVGDICMHFFAIPVPPDWQPVLSDEHDGWCWYRPDTGYVIGDKGIPSWDFHDRLARPDLSFIWAGWRLLGGKK